MTKPTEFTELFKLLRTNKKFPMWKISVATRISPSQLFNIENGTKLPSDPKIIKIIENLLEIKDGKLVTLAQEACLCSRLSIYQLLSRKPKLRKLVAHLNQITDKQLDIVLTFIVNQKDKR